MISSLTICVIYTFDISLYTSHCTHISVINLTYLKYFQSHHWHVTSLHSLSLHTYDIIIVIMIIICNEMQWGNVRHWSYAGPAVLVSLACTKHINVMATLEKLYALTFWPDFKTIWNKRFYHHRLKVWNSVKLQSLVAKYCKVRKIWAWKVCNFYIFTKFVVYTTQFYCHKVFDL